ncbi:MAG: hypothetical protein H6918_10490 [Sphingomonadaceae bacterium]|nr:hypothetical protein [Sphingomonadaceae bacterium]
MRKFMTLSALSPVLLLAACQTGPQSDLPQFTSSLASQPEVLGPPPANPQPCNEVEPFTGSNGRRHYWSCTPHPQCAMRVHFSRSSSGVYRLTQYVANYGLRYRYTPHPLPPSSMGSDRARSIMEEVRSLRGTPLGPDETWYFDRDVDCSPGNFVSVHGMNRHQP